MKTWAVALGALKNGIPVTRLIFVSAFDEMEANNKAAKALFVLFLEKNGYRNHWFAVQDTQSMYDELKKVQEWDK